MPHGTTQRQLHLHHCNSVAILPAVCQQADLTSLCHIRLVWRAHAGATRLRFSRDARLADVSSLLSSSGTVTLSLDAADSDPDLPAKQQQQVMRLTPLALPPLLCLLCCMEV